jgi:hypothetical protein
MSKSTELVVDLGDHIRNAGVMSGNKWNIQYAIEKCHDALCPLDQEQLNRVAEDFSAIITLANIYADYTPGKRRFEIDGS